ncbi:putative tRNA-specific adenosine-34 deaminase subunit Tad3 [Aspergillus fischeri NRRL 181]|uniref:tRNA-specific adenosine-34 deaminase subunit Tad3, putative n=1 Tax=Neosartorya fischeri (strain ATCC 1020 / DSM 3700 / CBS 544.65 / FGSC A1164 / JCM 1740 / NRRL 181 / WB 181) TaxID=331117 RepID=A1D3R9_NEOFI|nr:tRNA-specific adenosine-34 deaminase subunit Tad3, putative [Aspergillus fischeri NRRL 181]EAW23062.1 tRNA-specific adenosine-34 deaminase subunit Tad3, putative [Aspergillus fischeri NRRL 181]
MEVRDILRSIEPLQGRVLPIKTVQETQTTEEFEDAYVAEVNVKLASKVVKALDAAFPRDPAIPVNHLRRFAKHSQLPESLRSAINHNESTPQTIFVLISPPLPEVDALQKVLAPFAPASSTSPEDQTQPAPAISLHTIRIPTQPPLNAKQAEKWTSTYWPVVYNPAAPRATIAPPPQILNRALESIQPEAGYYLALAEKVAQEAEKSGRGRRIGAVVVDPEILASIDTSDDEDGTRWTDAVVAVAGDARYSRREAGALSESEQQIEPGPPAAAQTYNSDLEGGPELHPLMRAVEMIARKRCEEDREASDTKPYLSPLESYFLSQSDVSTSVSRLDSQDPSPVPEKLLKTNSASPVVPMTSNTPPVAPVAAPVAAPRIRSRAQGGYLCTDLDVYLTHEPCLCCSMGMLLSRFRAVIFPRKGRMVTGGLASEPVVLPACDTGPEGEPEESGSKAPMEETSDPATKRKYYGLHWRKELNWRALGFEFVEHDDDDLARCTESQTGVAFHA